MDSMEDSGFDSDQKSMQNGASETRMPSPPATAGNHTESKTSGNTYKKSAHLQRKIDKHRENAAKKARVVNQQPKNTYMVPRSRLMIPARTDSSAPRSQDQQPLVAIMTDDSDDDFDSPMLPRAAHKEITQQLIKDGYNLDLEPDDEDLDLIPPRPLNERCVCCQTYVGSCVIQ